MLSHDALHAYCKRSIRNIVNCIENPTFDISKEVDWLLSQLDSIIHHVNIAIQAGIIEYFNSNEITEVGNMIRKLAAQKRNDVFHNEMKKIICGKGRPKFDILEGQLEFLRKLNFNTPDIAKILGVSKSTVKRRISQFKLNRKYIITDITDANLDNIINEIQKEFPRTGYRRMIGYLRARGILVPEKRVRAAMQRVDLEGVLLRSL